MKSFPVKDPKTNKTYFISEDEMLLIGLTENSKKMVTKKGA